MKFFLPLQILSLLSFSCIGGEVVFLNETQLKAIDVSCEHFKSHTKWKKFDIALEDIKDDFVVTFFTPLESSEIRGNGKAVEYIVSKKEFIIERITQINSR